jgi:hypothetical protein
MTTATARRIVAIVLLGLVLVLAPAAFAAKGKPGAAGGGGSSLELVVLDPDDGGANHGEQVTFRLVTTTSQPQVSALCYQNGALVYSASAGFWDGYPWPWAQTFTLQSSSWTSGAADCTAKLEYWDGRRFRSLTSIGFRVNA